MKKIKIEINNNKKYIKVHENKITKLKYITMSCCAPSAARKLHSRGRMVPKALWK